MFGIELLRAKEPSQEPFLSIHIIERYPCDSTLLGFWCFDIRLLSKKIVRVYKYSGYDVDIKTKMNWI
jgi:hypothetical protein